MVSFHLAFPVDDLEKAHSFYHGFLGCPMGRTHQNWLDFNFYGHQITAHLKPQECVPVNTNSVDGDKVPVRHFGAILDWNDWQILADKVAESDYEFLVAPKIRFKDKAGEQGTFFLNDPAGNALEFKSFKNKKMIFAQGLDENYA